VLLKSAIYITRNEWILDDVPHGDRDNKNGDQAKRNQFEGKTNI
jgi:hypothetical protein